MELLIDRLGARGDGIADTPDGPVYVAGALPGERIETGKLTPRGDGRSAEVKNLIDPSPDRIAAACTHFGTCGGCVAQHAGGAVYTGWKRDLVSSALDRHGVAAEVLPPVTVAPATRRRVRLAFRRAGRNTVLGFREGRSDRIVDLAECAVAVPAIVDVLPALRDFFRRHVDRGEVSLTATDTGLDVTVFAGDEPSLDLRLDAPEFCAGANIARLSWASGSDIPDPVIALHPPKVRLGGRDVAVPADSFLQPTGAGEAALRKFVSENAGESAVIADLYAGCGTFTLPLAAAGKTVHAVESVDAQVAALRAAAAGLNVTAETRDLVRQPLRSEDFKPYDAVVLDPPRAGAAPQIEQLAASDVPLIVHVSCSPTTFARDARVLIDGGYAIGPVQPVDQFLWSHHVELAAAFRRT